MKIENCPYSTRCGENKSDIVNNSIWFCGHRTFCPYETCELPAPVVRPKEVVKTAKDIEAEALMTSKKLMAERFAKLKKYEEEGLSRSRAAEMLGISYYTVESIEEEFGYKFKFKQPYVIDWSQYDDKIIELKKANPKMTAENIAKLIGLKRSAVANRWTILKTVTSC